MMRILMVLFAKFVSTKEHTAHRRSLDFKAVYKLQKSNCKDEGP